MGKYISSEYEDRICHWIRTLKADFYTPVEDLSFSFCPAWGHMTLEEVKQQEFVPVEPGFTWGSSYGYGWFKTCFCIPRELSEKRLVLNLDPGGEAALFINDQAFGTYRADWIKQPHHYMVDNFLPKGCDSKIELYMEVYAGHYFPEAESRDCAVGPVLPGFYKDSLVEGKRRTLGTCTFGIWDEDAYGLYMDVMTLKGLFSVLDPDSLRAERIADALEQFTLCVDFEQEKEKRRESYREERKILRPLLEAKNGDTMPVFSCIGNSHLDLVWLWTKEETIRKTARTFAAQLRLLEEYPDYYYIQSQPACYELCREHYPELFDRIRKAVKEGHWIAEGAMWVEPDTNMAGGEALVRQLLYGKKYYREMFHVDSCLLWLPDTFGYSAALPQILKNCGVKYLVTQKIFWSYNDGEPFPYHYFGWKGMDGSQITSFLPTSYTYDTTPEELNHVWKNRVQKRKLDSFLIPFGYGDGGGGPTRDHIEYLERQKDLEGDVKVRLESPVDYFERMKEKGGPEYIYNGELYFNAHRGTYTSQAMIKYLNRRTEFALRGAELWSSVAGKVTGYPYQAEKLENLWKKLLFNQFHDILPGSSIGKVYETAEKELEDTRKKAQGIAGEALKNMVRSGNGITVFNSLPFSRKVCVELPDTFTGCVTDQGEKLPVYQNEMNRYVLVQVSPLGAKVLLPAAENEVQTHCVPQTAVYEENDDFIMENEYLRAVINKEGEIISLKLRKEEQEFACGSQNHFRLFKDVPRKFDAWDIDSNYEKQEIRLSGKVETKIRKQGGRTAELTVRRQVGQSDIFQVIRLETGSHRIEFDTEIDWKEQHRLLKVSFPTTIMSENGINEIQYGFIERPMHRSRAYEQDRFEVCNHRYSAVCDGGNGFGILNDCKYGISMKDGILELTLLRGGACPDFMADQRKHHFTYGITPWKGSFQNSDIIAQGYELNEKPYMIFGTGQTFSLASMDKEHMVIDTVKMAEDGSGDLIFRIYEGKKWMDDGVLSMGIPAEQAWECDMLENKKTELEIVSNKISMHFRAFEIKTLRIRTEKVNGG